MIIRNQHGRMFLVRSVSAYPHDWLGVEIDTTTLRPVAWARREHPIPKANTCIVKTMPITATERLLGPYRHVK